MGSNSVPPHPNDHSMIEEMEQYWGGPWGVRTEYRPLEKVMVHRPTKEELLAVHGNEARWIWGGDFSPQDVTTYKEEHDRLVNTFEELGVEVYYLKKSRKNKAKLYFMRDPFVMTPEGAIVSRMALNQRRGEEKVVTERLGELGIPILHTVYGKGQFEGGNLMYIDEKTAVIGTGIRTNSNGATQTARILHDVGYEEVKILPIPSYWTNLQQIGYVHIDVVFNVIDEKKAVIYPEGLPYRFLRELKEKKDFELIELPRDEVHNMGTNMLTVKPGTVVSVAGNETTKAKLEDRGIEVIEVDIPHLVWGGGGVRCITMPLLRKEA